jgi:hypothetical protein
MSSFKKCLCDPWAFRDPKKCLHVRFFLMSHAGSPLKMLVGQYISSKDG